MSSVALSFSRERASYRVQTLLRRGLDGREWTAEVRGHIDSPDEAWRTHATARVRLASSPPHALTFDAPLASRLSKEDAYAELADLGLQYGPTFRGIEWLSREGEGVLACVRMPDGLDARPYLFHPALRDAAMHVVVLAEACRGHYGVLPVRIARIWIRSRPSTVLRSHARVRQIDGRIHADVRVETADGDVIEIAEGIELAHLDDAIVSSDVTSEEASWLYGVEWAELPRREASEPFHRPIGAPHLASGWFSPIGRAWAQLSRGDPRRRGADHRPDAGRIE